VREPGALGEPGKGPGGPKKGPGGPGRILRVHKKEEKARKKAKEKRLKD
jgi:hypothetical protein